MTSDFSQLIFMTPAGTRVGNVLFVLVAGVGGGLLISLFGAGFVYAVSSSLGVPTVIAAVPALGAWLLVMRNVCNMSVTLLRFRVVLTQDSVQVGSDGLECVFPYDAVEEISLPTEASEHGIGLEGGGQSVFVRLSAEDQEICSAELRQRCPYALFVDRWGQEHLPENADRPQMTLGALYRHLRSRIWGSYFAAVWLGALGIGRGGIVYQEVAGEMARLTPLQVVVQGILSVACLAIAVSLVCFATSQWQKSIWVRSQMSQFKNHQPRRGESQ